MALKKEKKKKPCRGMKFTAVERKLRKRTKLLLKWTSPRPLAESLKAEGYQLQKATRRHISGMILDLLIDA